MENTLKLTREEACMIHTALSGRKDELIYGNYHHQEMIEMLYDAPKTNVRAMSELRRATDNKRQNDKEITVIDGLLEQLDPMVAIEKRITETE